MLAVFHIVEFFVPWAWLVLAAMFYFRTKTNAALFVLLSMLLVCASDIMIFFEGFFIQNRTESQISEITHNFRVISAATKSLGLLLLTGAVIWLVRSDLWDSNAGIPAEKKPDS